MFPWQHILETVFMRNGAIQFSNDITVTLFPIKSLQTFEAFLEMINGTSVENFCIKNALYCHGNRFFQEYLRKIGS